MSVPPIQMAALEWAGAAAGTLAGPWKPGAVVFGKVLEHALGTRLILQISGLTVEAESPTPQRVPQQFQARVIRAGANPLLEVLAPPRGDGAVDAALRTRLPRQGGFQPLLSDLSALAHAPNVRALPEEVRIALAQLEASIVDRRDVLDPEVLRDALRRGGQGLEPTLLQQARAGTPASGGALGYDLKAVLLRLAASLAKLPPAAAPTADPARAARDASPPLLELPLAPQPRLPQPGVTEVLALAGGMLHHAEAALARIEIMQLEAQPQALPQAWMVEIPVRDDQGFDLLQVRFDERSPGPGSDAPPEWTLGFILEPPELGAVQGRIRLAGARVHVDLWAARAEAVAVLEEQSAVLPRLLAASGLELVQLRVRHGLPVRETGLGHRLLETSA